MPVFNRADWIILVIEKGDGKGKFSNYLLLKSILKLRKYLYIDS